MSNNTAFAQTQKTNKEVVHKAIDKMNYEFAIAVLKRIKKGDPNSVIEVNQKVNDTTFARVRALEPNIKANSIKRMFSKEKLSDNVTGYIYEIDYIKFSSKYYPTNDVLSAVQSLEKIVDKIITRTKDFGDEQKAFTLKDEEIKALKERLNKIKNSAISQLNTEKPTDAENQTDSIKADTTKQNSTLETKVVEDSTQTASSEIMYYRINQDEEKELVGTNETSEGEKTTYKFGLDIKKTDSIHIRIKNNPTLDTTFLVANANTSLILEEKDNRYIIDLNIATTQEDDYMMWIIFGVIAISIIAFVMYKQYEKNKPTVPREAKKDIVKKDPLSRDNVVVNTVSSTNQKIENKEEKTQIIQNQIKEEKNRLTAILTNSKLSDEQKLKEARSKNIILEIANNAEIKELMRVIGELSTKTKVENTEKESIKNQETTSTPKVETQPKNNITSQEPLYVSLSDIGENGISSERTKGMSNSIFVIRPYNDKNNEAKKADLMLHSDIKDMAFESIFRSIEKLDHVMEHSTFSESAKKITQEEKGELIKEDNVWKVKKRLKVKFS
ncbi:hypothetical protein V9L05_08345 [Bernardetia sp. Wsw4-3y2]|uniref:hypothetical protein n=1 Tax=Bernardetia sp. Wsw4-3y2 TaxID=3127471 RepID=UPI0030D0C679